MATTEMNSGPTTLACHTWWTLRTALKDDAITLERRYIMAERLCIMIPEGTPTDEQLIAASAEAIANADDWEDRYMDSI